MKALLLFLQTPPKDTYCFTTTFDHQQEFSLQGKAVAHCSDLLNKGRWCPPLVFSMYILGSILPTAVNIQLHSISFLWQRHTWYSQLRFSCHIQVDCSYPSSPTSTHRHYHDPPPHGWVLLSRIHTAIRGHTKKSKKIPQAPTICLRKAWLPPQQPESHSMLCKQEPL